MRIGLGLGITDLRGGGGAPAVNNRAATLAQSPVFMFDTADATTRFRTSGGATASAGESVQLIQDLTTNGYDLVQTNTTAVPIVNADGVSIEFDGTSDRMLFTGLTGAAWTPLTSMSFFAGIKTSDTFSVIFGAEAGSEYIGWFEDGSAVFTTATTGASTEYYVNGTSLGIATRDDLHTAFATGSWVLIEVRLANMSAWTATAQLGRWSTAGGGAYFSGQYANPVLIPTANITDRAAIEAFVMESVS